MEALELAMKMEQDGENFYRRLAEKATNIGFRDIFTQLANDEVKHLQLFQNINQLQNSFVKTEVFKNASKIFKRMIAEDIMKNLDSSQLDLYQEAMGLEKKSQKFYLEKASETFDENQRGLFRMIAAEEEEHYLLLHNISNWFLGRGHGLKMVSLPIWRIINKRAY
ncbi:MAG TPA: ferritin family protein [Bacillota bacterium]|nr:ferritin family protein [Bacillota bacterium]